MLTSRIPAPASSSILSGAAGKSAAVAEERRGSMRVCRRVETKLIGRGLEQGVFCTTSDISEGGLFVRLPANAGVAVGQRFEVVLPDESQAPDLAGFMSGGCYATIVRTERPREAASDLIGVGLRFDQPLFL
ncbi:MAG: PilZ domain-containing protein [Planctomycetes bacterium]|nr:PilZ domain-containing protein [Planctomycetota bacterium]